MKKITTLFARDQQTKLVTQEVSAGCEWVLSGEGRATRKLDGSCCMVRGGALFKRYEVKPGGKAPPNFEPANCVDPETGKQQGWLPVGDGPEDKWHREAFAATGRILQGVIPDGTYELLGPKVQGNPEKAECHYLEPHGQEVLQGVPRDYEGIKEYLRTHNIEGIVWWHEDGRMVKVKGKDMGIKRAK